LTVHAGSGLEEGTLWVIAHVYGESGPHGVVWGATVAYEIPRFEGQLGNVRVVQGVANLFEDETRRGLEVQNGLSYGEISLDTSG
jgi:hypothetical protein